MFTRRQFLGSSVKSASVVSLASTVPCFLPNTLNAANKNAADRILVVIELSGGNDGLNTVIPFADDNYAKFRKTLRIPTSQVLKLNDEVGLHPAMGGMSELIKDDRLAVVQNVGYPNPNRSHFESAAIWHSAQANPEADGGYGWLGRALDTRSGQVRTMADAICLGDVDPPRALRGRRATRSTIRRIEELKLDHQFTNAKSPNTEEPTGDLLEFVRRRTADARVTAARIDKLFKTNDGKVNYPGTGLGNRLKAIARLIRAELEPRVYYTVQGGYDTHVDQYNDHFRLLGQFSGALKAFLDDLRESKLDDQVLVMVFSEFGRRVQENDSQGTDHGTAGPMFIAGSSVKAGVHGKPANLTDLDDGDLKMAVDFRSVYANVLADWLQIDPTRCLPGSSKPTDLLKV